MKWNMNAEIKGKEYWRSLEELAETEEFKEFLHREFPAGASEMNDPVTRRSFLSLMGASLALAGLASCRRPVENIVPYVAPPEEVIPGKPLFYATTMPFQNGAYGLIAESHEGRPTKLEGNKLHPSTLGASNPFIQGEILNLYDPDRSRRILEEGIARTWDEFVSFWRLQLPGLRANRGKGLAILTESYSSPTISRLMAGFREAFPEALWACYEPVSDENIYEGIRLATGDTYMPHYYFDKADVILSIDSDFLLSESGNIRNARGFALGRRVKNINDAMNRLYAVEASFSTTGAMADHRLRLASSAMPRFAAALAGELAALGLPVATAGNPGNNPPEGIDPGWIRAVAEDLADKKGKSLIVAGRRQPAAVHALVFMMNSALLNIGKTVTYRNLQDSALPKREDLVRLTASLEKKEISTLIIAGGNPVYTAPRDVGFAAAMKNAAKTIHLGLYEDETAEECLWHVPLNHFLESWGDARGFDGTAGVVQSLIAPLFETRDLCEALNLFITGEQRRACDLVRDTWKEILGESGFEEKWRRVLHDGLLPGSAPEETAPPENRSAFSEAMAKYPFQSPEYSSGSLELNFYPSPSVFDGRYANNGWLQELSDPVTKLTWDNAAVMSPKTAEELSVVNSELVIIACSGGNLAMPVFVVPGQADYTIAVNLGYGRTKSGKIGNGIGFNTYRLRTVSAPDFMPDATVLKTGEKYLLATTQLHQSMEGRPIIREATLEEYRKEPNFAAEMVEHPPLISMWKEHSYKEGYQWGMAIDLNACIGCNACVIACQSENNIPIVGKEQVHKGREMQWIRVDRYFNGETEDPEMVFQPVNCQHCENAPCEQVCPVNATVHDREGLNLMVYNRCVGTRYCSNNCPYKVRRFNFFNYTGDMPELMKMAQNPDVTVRSRGVMEKCSYCLQRINRARYAAQNENRTVKDGEFQTACQQSCPANAIVFGNINDPESEVSRTKSGNRNYELLAELNTKPRTSFLAKIRNPNPKLTES